jgi:hypothetical protein
VGCRFKLVLDDSLGAKERGKSDVGGQSNARIPSRGSRREERLRDLIQWCKLKPEFEAKLSRNG